jgi:NAD(P)-dependent dehydrogenase (short-subunit alcohol dehydrogenase family)
MCASKLQGNIMTKSVVLITGALTGIGRATAIEFAKKGAQLVVSGRRAEVGEELVTVLRGLGTVPMQRIGQVEEIARAIVFAASAEASFITGHILTVDGGKSAQ